MESLSSPGGSGVSGYQPWGGDRKDIGAEHLESEQEKRWKGDVSRLRGQAEEKEGAPGEEDAVVSDT